jgi:tetratricopeptide (TPR) repeat protein
MILVFPNDAVGHNRLGIDYMFLGQREKAAQQFREAIRLYKDNGSPYLNLSSVYSRLGRLDEARVILDEAKSRGFDNEAIWVMRYILAFLEGDDAGMKRLMKEAEGRPGYEDQLLFEGSCVEAFYGRWGNARELNEKSRASANKAGAPGRAAGYLAEAAMAAGYMGNLAEAKRLARQVLAGSNLSNAA